MRSLNLLPWRDQRQRTRRREAFAALACGLFGALGVVALAESHFAGKLDAARQQASQFEDAIAVHRDAAADRRALEERSANMAAMLAEVGRVREHNRAVRDWLEQLPEAVPPELRLKRLAISGTDWELQGVARNLETAARLLQAIRAMPMVSEARIAHLRSDSVQGREFVLAGGFTE